METQKGQKHEQCEKYKKKSSNGVINGKEKKGKYNYSISWVNQPSTVNLIFYVMYLDFHYTFLWLNLS